jgi:uncharacterized protein involved in exopolysaccharide biosynthesis
MNERLQVGQMRSESHPSLRDLAAVFFRRTWLLKISFLLVFAAGMVYSIISPSYEAKMKVLVQRGRIDPAITPTQSVTPLMQQEVSEEELNSQAELLHDDDLLRQVVIETGLVGRTSWIAALTGQSRDERIAHAIKRLAAKIEVTPVRKSQIIAISYKSPDPAQSATVLRSLSTAYLARQVEIRRPSGQQAFFDQQMKQSRAGLDTAQQSLLQYLQTHQVASASLERDLALQRLSEAQSADMGLRAAIAESAERVHSLEGKLRELPERRVVQTKNTDNPQLQEKLKSKLLELELKRTELLTKFQPSYRLVTEVEEQIVQAKSAIHAEEVRPLRDETTQEDPDHEWANSEKIKDLVEMQGLIKRQTVTEREVIEYRSASQRLAESVIQQGELERQVKAAEDKYLLYASKREEARIGDALDQSGILNVTIADQPHAPVLPASPLWLTSCLSLAAACVVSTGSVFVADYIDPSIRTPEEAIRLLRSPVLISLPAAAQSPQSPRENA